MFFPPNPNVLLLIARDSELTRLSYTPCHSQTQKFRFHLGSEPQMPSSCLSQFQRGIGHLCKGVLNRVQRVQSRVCEHTIWNFQESLRITCIGRYGLQGWDHTLRGSYRNRPKLNSKTQRSR